MAMKGRCGSASRTSASALRAGHGGGALAAEQDGAPSRGRAAPPRGRRRRRAAACTVQPAASSASAIVRASGSGTSASRTRSERCGSIVRSSASQRLRFSATATRPLASAAGRSAPRRAPGRRTAGPARAGSPARRGTAPARGVSTPSATVSIPSASDSAMTASHDRAGSGSSGISRRNERSILRMCTGSSRSRESDDQPAPKSSIASRSPPVVELAQDRPDPLGLAQRGRLGQLHRQPRRVDAELAPAARSARAAKSGPVQLARRDVEAHVRLAAPARATRGSAAAIAPITQSPIGSSRLISSAAGMKSSG